MLLPCRMAASFFFRCAILMVVQEEKLSARMAAVMRITFLGTGTSHGIPVIGCHCPVCTSPDVHDRRYRSSIMVEEGGSRLVVDTGYEFRLQMLREHVDSLDGVLYTHSHADHLSGIDDLRVFSQKRNMTIYSNGPTLKYIEEHYSYAFSPSGFPGNPLLEAVELEPLREVEIAGIRVIPLPVEHGRMTHMPIYGYRFGRFAYITDCTFIPESVFDSLKGVEILAIGGLRKRPHGAHFCFEEAHAAGRRTGAAMIYFTHINHETCYNEINSLYPDARSAYDGLVLEV